jgi:hypothetical protein
LVTRITTATNSALQHGPRWGIGTEGEMIAGLAFPQGFTEDEDTDGTRSLWITI